MNREAAIEANLGAFLLALGRAGGGEERITPRLAMTIGGSPIDYHNAAFNARLDTTEADAAIAETIALFRRHGIPGSWHLGPSSQPEDLPRRLVAQGFVTGFPERGMAASLAAIDLDIDDPSGVTSAEVLTEAQLEDWISTLATGFGEGPAEAEWVGGCWRRLGYGPGTSWRHFVARLDGRPSATATLFLHDDTAGLYFVFTAEPARRRGIGGAITRAALRTAHGLGFEQAVLGASAAGATLYSRLGFEDVCALPIFEWHPPSA